MYLLGQFTVVVTLLFLRSSPSFSSRLMNLSASGIKFWPVLLSLDYLLSELMDSLTIFELTLCKESWTIFLHEHSTELQTYISNLLREEFTWIF